VILFPPAKINLGLQVLRKRVDGFHEIATCMIPVPIHDILEVIPNHPEQMIVSGISVGGDVNDNLCWRAYKLLKENFGIPDTYIHLNKQIPMGAGLGGGSSDASYVLIALNDIYALNLSKDDLRRFAAELGSDCPFFVESIPQIASGRGEVLQAAEIRLGGYYLKLVNPGIHISTAEAYSGVVLKDQVPQIQEILALDPKSWKDLLSNSFEEHIFAKYPLLTEIKRKLYAEGAIYAAMSGSGSTIFALYKEQPKQTFVEYYEKIVQFNV